MVKLGRIKTAIGAIKSGGVGALKPEHPIITTLRAHGYGNNSPHFNTKTATWGRKLEKITKDPMTTHTVHIGSGSDWHHSSRVHTSFDVTHNSSGNGHEALGSFLSKFHEGGK